MAGPLYLRVSEVHSDPAFHPPDTHPFLLGTDLCLGSLLSFLESFLLLFHKTAVLRWWSPHRSLRVFSLPKEKQGNNFSLFTFILNYLVDFECLKIIIQKKKNSDRKLSKEDTLKIHSFCQKGVFKEAHN